MSKYFLFETLSIMLIIFLIGLAFVTYLNVPIVLGYIIGVTIGGIITIYILYNFGKDTSQTN